MKTLQVFLIESTLCLIKETVRGEYGVSTLIKNLSIEPFTIMLNILAQRTKTFLRVLNMSSLLPVECG